MPRFDLQSGLPTYPAGLNDEDAALVNPLYRAIAALTQQVSAATGVITYSPAEMAQADQFTKLINQRLNRIFARATEAISFGQLVNLHLVEGTVEARLANATNATRPAHACCDIPSGLAAGEWGEFVFMQGRVTGIGGTTFGARYFTSTTPGAVQIGVPGSAGNLIQIAGVGLGSAGFWLNLIPGGA